MSEVAQTSAPPAAVPDPPEEKTESEPTEYVILSLDKTGAWVEQTRVKSRGANSAVRDWLKGASEVEGTYVAVPSRSWKPVTVATETQTKLTFK